jgi:hypothetical protein
MGRIIPSNLVGLSGRNRELPDIAISLSPLLSRHNPNHPKEGPYAACVAAALCYRPLLCDTWS